MLAFFSFRNKHAWVMVFFGVLLLPLALNAQGQDTIRYETDIGPVTFDHKGHQNLLKNSCSTCHHLEEEEAKKACGNCHKGKIEAEEDGPPAFFDVKMKLCRGCHLKEREANRNSPAPIHCKECHDIKAQTKQPW